MKKRQFLLFFIALFLFPNENASGQMSYGGRPLMNAEDFNPVSVLYLIEGEDPEILEGLKSSGTNSLKKALHYASELPVDISPEGNGEWIEKSNMKIWRAHLISPGAYSVGVFFSEFKLEKGVRLFLYDPEGEDIKGSYTSENNKEFETFYVGHIPGEEVVIELQVDKGTDYYGNLRIGMLSHAFLPVYSKTKKYDTGLGTSQECEIDINCQEGEEWQTIKRSVCYISTTSLLCTGTLINNTLYDGAPYVLTAEHCINKSFYAQSSVFYFGYENSSCGEVNALKNRSISGSNMLSTGDSLDFTLVKLTKKPPREYEVYYAGWDVREQNHSEPSTLHHPNGDAMKISVDFNSTVNASSLPGDLNDYFLASNYRIEQWDIGTTEGGSSGCPLFNSHKKVVGLLTGGLAECGDSIGYDSQNNRVIYSLSSNRNDYFSKLYYDWDYYEQNSKQLKRWLDPINSGQLAIGGLSYNSVDVPSKLASESLFYSYPNPSDGAIFIELPEYDGGELKMCVYNLSGQIIDQRQLRSVYPLQVDLNDLNNGLYHIRISSKKKEFSGRIIIQK